jgi:hypothetical protein
MLKTKEFWWEKTQKTSENRQMGLNETKRLLHSKGKCSMPAELEKIFANNSAVENKCSEYIRSSKNSIVKEGKWEIDILQKRSANG